ncbi:hypothetical protein CLLU_14510 [Clostridium luticellarii]|uniref:HNH domain-containing protein n=1 Tax=Clostridium luticellarii TaxID=1691940 RepID=A0A2T0BNU1_9CLOT|nr:hypothetical protein CLLU_14510 [Clostridium luticellarii]
MSYKHCVNCGSTRLLQKHHVIHRSECGALIHCKKNLVYLCRKCHTEETYAVHQKNGHELDIKLKLEFQNWLESVFTEDRYTLDEIRKKLDISKDAARSLSKLMDIDRGAYCREDIIRTAMGGKIIDLEEIK